ncbi:MAG: TonB-dependent receptor [Reichenbachiella sp.]
MLKRFIFFFAFFTCISCSTFLKGQDIGTVILGHNATGEDFDTFFSSIEESHSIKFKYLPEWFENTEISKDYYNKTLKVALADILKETDLNYTVYYNYYFIFFKDPTEDIERQSIEDLSRPENQHGTVLIGSAENYIFGKRITISGTVRDVINNNPIIGATVLAEESNEGDVTDVNGYFSISVPQGYQTIKTSSVNYETENIKINAISDGKLDVTLYEYALTLQGVTIHSEAEDENVASAQVGKEMMSIETIKEIPTFMGEVDVIKSVLLLPGVSTVGEGAAGFNVRGGGVDQNLVLLDGVQVFNYSHLLGFFSAFNPTTVRDITLYKGGIPAEYGQRVSSILNIQSKNGSTESLGIEGGIGAVSSNLMIEGPIIKNKTSFLVSGRSSYSNWVTNSINDINVQNSSAFFYDLNARIKHKINEKNNISINSYYSHDEFSFADDTTYQWSTGIVSAKFNHVFNATFNANFMLGLGKYGYAIDEPQTQQAARLEFDVNYQQFSATFEKTLPKHKITYGLQANLYRFQPGTLNPTSPESNINAFELQEKKGLETGTFISDEFELSPKIVIIGGIRLSTYSAYGDLEVYNYDPSKSKIRENIIDTVYFTDNDISKSFYGLEPRLSVRYLLNTNSSIKLGFNRIYQYVHLISNTTAISPVDIWEPSGYHLDPQIGDQISLGYFKNFLNNTYEFSLEGYYKKLGNVVEYKNGAELLLNPTLEADLIQGEGRAYGMELMIKKNKGRLTGWASYTLSRSESKIEGEFRDETLNNGDYFPSNFNKPHDLSIVTTYELNRRVSFNLNFTYNTGRPITAPISKYFINDILVNNYSTRNKYTIPDYHRLDVGLTIKTNHKKNKFLEGHWTIAVYNVYGRKNAYSVFFDQNDNQNPVTKQLSVLGAPFPSISYNFKI